MFRSHYLLCGLLSLSGTHAGKLNFIVGIFAEINRSGISCEIANHLKLFWLSPLVGMLGSLSMYMLGNVFSRNCVYSSGRSDRKPAES